MEISQAILDDLTAKAKASERLRMNLDLRDSETMAGDGYLAAIAKRLEGNTGRLRKRWFA